MIESSDHVRDASIRDCMPLLGIVYIQLACRLLLYVQYPLGLACSIILHAASEQDLDHPRSRRSCEQSKTDGNSTLNRPEHCRTPTLKPTQVLCRKGGWYMDLMGGEGEMVRKGCVRAGVKSGGFKKPRYVSRRPHKDRRRC